MMETYRQRRFFYLYRGYPASSKNNFKAHSVATSLKKKVESSLYCRKEGKEVKSSMGELFVTRNYIEGGVGMNKRLVYLIMILVMMVWGLNTVALKF